MTPRLNGVLPCHRPAWSICVPGWANRWCTLTRRTAPRQGQGIWLERLARERIGPCGPPTTILTAWSPSAAGAGCSLASAQVDGKVLSCDPDERFWCAWYGRLRRSLARKDAARSAPATARD